MNVAKLLIYCKSKVTGHKTLEWILVAILVGFTWHYFWLMDDAFVYFRYLDNFIFLGRGLVYNQGEYVEGYTSPAWLLLLIPFRLFRLDYWTIVRSIAIVIAFIYGLFLIRLNRELSPSRARIVNLPLAIAAAHYGIVEHFSSGLETPLVQLWSVLLALWIVRPRSALLPLFAALTPLIRPELALPGLICAAGVWIRSRRFPLQFVIYLCGFTGIWLVFRVFYYADLLPNTYYLKGYADWRQGLWYLANGVEGQWWIWLVLVSWAGIITYVAAKRGLPNASDRGGLFARFVMVLAGIFVLIWVARIGGDMLYHRFLACPTTLFLCSIAGVSETLIGRIKFTRLRGVFAAATMAAAFYLSFTSYPPSLTAHPLTDPKIRVWHKIAEAQWHRTHKDLTPSPARALDDQRLLETYAEINLNNTPQTEVLVTPWCRDAFFAPEKYVINLFGLTDAILSRIEARIGRPGHKHLAYASYDLAAVIRSSGVRLELGIYRRAIDLESASSWIRKNINKIEITERKIYNRHRFLENLRLALQPVGCIER